MSAPVNSVLGYLAARSRGDQAIGAPGDTGPALALRPRLPLPQALDPSSFGFTEEELVSEPAPRRRRQPPAVAAVSDPVPARTPPVTQPRDAAAPVAAAQVHPRTTHAEPAPPTPTAATPASSPRGSVQSEAVVATIRPAPKPEPPAGPATPAAAITPPGTDVPAELPVPPTTPILSEPIRPVADAAPAEPVDTAPPPIVERDAPAPTPADRPSQAILPRPIDRAAAQITPRPEPVPAASPPPQVQVTIGRIEIRGAAPPPPAKPRAPAMSLDDYLAKRAGG